MSISSECSELIKVIEAEAEKLALRVGAGGATDFSSYKEQVGTVKGLKKAASLIRDHKEKNKDILLDDD